MKLTKARQELLREMARGTGARGHSPIRGDYRFVLQTWGQSTLVSRRTWQPLLDAGLIALVYHTRTSDRYEITDAGREALEEA